VRSCNIKRDDDGAINDDYDTRGGGRDDGDKDDTGKVGDDSSSILCPSLACLPVTIFAVLRATFFAFLY